MLPNLLIIGAMNCGTTSLHYYLNLHPEISMTEEKELDFFVKETNYKLGSEWYKSHFKNMKTKIRGESSPSYTKYPKFEGVSLRIFKLLPDIKMIYLVRHPIERIISHYHHNLSKGRESRTLEQALLNLGENSYFLYCKYYTQLTRYFRYFDKDQVLILDSQDLLQNRTDVLKKIFRFLEVDESFSHSEFNKVLHTSKEKTAGNQLAAYIQKNTRLHAYLTKLPDYINNLILNKDIEIKDMNPKTRSKIMRYLGKEIDGLRKVSGLELEGWL